MKKCFKTIIGTLATSGTEIKSVDIKSKLGVPIPINDIEDFNQFVRNLYDVDSVIRKSLVSLLFSLLIR